MTNYTITFYQASGTDRIERSTFNRNYSSLSCAKRFATRNNQYDMAVITINHKGIDVDITDKYRDEKWSKVLDLDTI